MGDWNLADLYDIAAEVRADEPAITHRGRTITWRDFDRRASNVGAWMLDKGATHQAKVAIFTYNDVAYVEMLYAAFKASIVPVNVNYRYRADELRYLLENSDSEIVLVHEEFVDLLAEVLADLPLIRGVLVVGTGTADLSQLPGAEWYEPVAETDRDLTELRAVTRSGDDMLLLYTGGTTGMPKGVMWRQDDMYDKLGGGGLADSPKTAEDARAFFENPPLRVRILIGPPLMHGTGMFTALVALLTGGSVVLMDDPKHFDPAEFWATVESEKPTGATIVGDSFAKPLVRELREGGRTYDLSSIVMMVSSGVMWSEPTKLALLEFHPGMLLVDQFSSSEALGMGSSIMSAAGPVQTARFQITPFTRLFDEQLNALETKPGVKGLVGVGGSQPLGYYKDPDKTARTFTEVDGVRFSVPGDWAVVDDDGVSLQLLGRGSVCINTGGEKVFPEEVEEAIKKVDGVRDVVVVGVPDDKFGEVVTAVVSRIQPETPDAETVISSVKESLAGFKAPKHVVFVEDVYRSPSGKADFKRTRETALEALGIKA